jgi:hypothetical protein
MLARDTYADPTFDYATVNFNGDSSTANYTYHLLTGNGSAATASGGGTGAVSYILGGYIPSGNNAANIFGASIVDILDYTSSKNKTVRTFGGWDKNGAGNAALLSGLWLNTSAITSIVIGTQNGNLAQYSSFALYGIKG